MEFEPDKLQQNEGKLKPENGLPQQEQIPNETTVSPEQAQAQARARAENLEARERESTQNDAKESNRIREELGITSSDKEHDHEHGHGENEEDNQKIADGIISRANGMPARVQEKAKVFAERVANEGLRAIMEPQNDFSHLVKNPRNEVGGGNYDDWKKPDIEALYYALYGEDLNDDAKERREFGERLRQQRENEPKNTDDEKLAAEIEIVKSNMMDPDALTREEIIEAAKSRIEYRKKQKDQPPVAKPKSFFSRIFGIGK